MSILIKGMEMPGSCDECILNNGITCYAVPDYKEDGVVGRTDDRPDWCPLVPVPPHGRLIEAEPIVKYVTDGLNSGELGYDAIKVMTEVEYAPTIIPAEEGE